MFVSAATISISSSGTNHAPWASVATTGTLSIAPARAVPPKAGTMAWGVSRSIIGVQQNPEYAQYTLLLGRLAEPQHIGVLLIYSVFVLHLACGMP